MINDIVTRPVRFGRSLIELPLSQADVAQVDGLPASNAPCPPVALVLHAGTGDPYWVARNESGLLRAWPATDDLLATIVKALWLLDEEV